MPQPTVVLIPVFNDWTALGLLLQQLDQIAAPQGAMQVVVVDDASTEEAAADFPGSTYRAISNIVVLRLRRNLGHQRAIATGMVYVYQNIPDAITIVMDGDGEDRPEDIPTLLETFNAAHGRKIIFAERARRTEGLVFKFFYHFYKAIHLALTGIPVRVGNFSVVPHSCLSSLVVISEMWNHYAAAVLNARLPYDTAPVARGHRLSGKSKMNFVSLVSHGLRALSVYSDIVGARLLAISGLTIVLLVLAIVAILVSGWWLPVIGLLLVLLVQAVGMSLVFVFFVLSGRSGALFLPIRDCPYFIGEVRTVYAPGGMPG